MPSNIDVNENSIIAYVKEFSIYVEAEVEDKSRPIVIKPTLTSSVCQNNTCERIELKPFTELQPSEKVKSTIYSAFVTTISMNVEALENSKNYKIGKVVWEKKNDGSLGSIRLDVKAKNLSKLDVFIVGDEARYFRKPRYSFEDDSLVVRFDLDDLEYNPLNKDLSFWLSINNLSHYVHKQKVEEMSMFDIKSSMMSWGILGFAFLGGILLNLMPCVFPVLSLKLLNYSLFGKLTVKQIRKNFILNTIGILTSFAIMAMGLSCLKYFGVAIGWGMQFQSICFLTTVLWVVIFFFFYVSGMFDLNISGVDKKLAKYSNKSMSFEFLSGAFLVLLSTPCMAPYLGTAFGVALTGSIKSIMATVMTVGLGLAFPYILIALFPKVALYIPRPGKWMSWINFVMLLLLVVTIIWLLSILIVQTSIAQVWHWILYILIMTLVLYYWKFARKEIEKQNDKKLINMLNKKFAMIFIPVILLIMIISYFDVISDANARKEFIGETHETRLDIEQIDSKVNNGEKVLVKVGADWCLTCKYNDMAVFDISYIQDEFERFGVSVINVDWTKYQPQVLRFMQKFGRSGLPFYVLFSKRYPKGVVLPEIVDSYDLQVLIEK